MDLLECLSYDRNIDHSVTLRFPDDSSATVKLEFLSEDSGRPLSHGMLYRYYDTGAHSG